MKSCAMHRKHRTRHHNESKHKHVSKKHSKSASKRHHDQESNHVSFVGQNHSRKVDGNACGDFEPRHKSEDKQMHKEKPKNQADKEQKQQNVEKYLRELTKPQPESIKQPSPERLVGNMLNKTKTTVKKHHHDGTFIDATNKELNPKLVEQKTERKPQHRHRSSSHKHKTHEHKEKHHKKHSNHDKHRKPSKESRKNRHKAPDNVFEKNCQGTVQEVLFYQVAPTSYPVKDEKQSNEIKDLYHRKEKAKSSERKHEKHREVKQTKAEDTQGHKNIKTSTENECLLSNTKEEKIHYKEKQKSPAVEHIHCYHEHKREKSKEKKLKRKLASSELQNVHEKCLADDKRDTKSKEISFQQKIESDIKKYFSKIQSLIDQKFELILKDSKLKVHSKEAEQQTSKVRRVRRPKSEEPHSKNVDDHDNKKEENDETNINKERKVCRHRRESSVTFDLCGEKERKRKIKNSKAAEQNNKEPKNPNPQAFISGFTPIPIVPCASEGLSKLESHQSRVTNYTFRHPEPPYEWIFPPELWNLKIQDLLLASQNKQFFMPPEFVPTSRDDLKGKTSHSSMVTSPILRKNEVKQPDFLVQGIEPPSLDGAGRKLKKPTAEKNLECKTVSIISIKPHIRELKITNESETQRTPNSASDDLVEKRKKSKRFKIYYKYSQENSLNNNNDVAYSSDGKSVVSDSHKIFNDPNEENSKNPPQKRKILEQQLVQNIFIKLQDKPIKNRKPATPIPSKLNNIVEEQTNSSGVSVNQCYFNSLSTSNSESCLKIDKKPANSSISIPLNQRPIKKVCKYCKHGFRSKSDVKITSQKPSKMFKSKSDVIIDPSNARHIFKTILLDNGHNYIKTRRSRRQVHQDNCKIKKEKLQTTLGCQTSEYKVSQEEEIKEKQAYEEKKKQFKQIYKTIEYLEDGIQTVSQKFSSKKVYINTAVGRDTFAVNCVSTKTESPKRNIDTGTISSQKKEKTKVQVKDTAIGLSEDDEGTNGAKIELKSAACSPICIRGPKSPTRSKPKSPGPNQNVNGSTRTRNTSPPKPAPRKCVVSRATPLRKPVIPPTQVIVLRNSKTNLQEKSNVENRRGTKTTRVHAECSPEGRFNKISPRSRPPTIRQPSNVEELLRGVLEEKRKAERKEKLQIETPVIVEDKKPPKPFRFKDEDCKICSRTPNFRQTRPASCLTPSAPRATPITRHNTVREKPKDIIPEQVQLFSKEKSRPSSPEGCIHITNPKEKKVEVKMKDTGFPKKSVYRAELNSHNLSLTKKISGSTSSSVSDTAIQIQEETKAIQRSQSLVDVKTYIKNVINQEPQIYAQTEAILLTTADIKSQLDKFITEPRSRSIQAKSNVQSLDQYDEKYKSTMLLTKQDKNRGLSSYQKRKTYDAFRRQKIKNNIRSNLAQQVYYNINNIVNQQNLYNYGEHKKNIPIRKHNCNTDSQAPNDPVLESDVKNLIEKPSLVTLFVKNYDDNHIKLFNFCKKLLQVSSSLEFPFNIGECSCRDISENCQTCTDFIKNLGAFFTEASLLYHKDDIPQFEEHYNNATASLDNEVCDFYTNEDFNSESFVENGSDTHDSVTAGIFYPNEIQQETMTKICEEIFPGGFNNITMSKYVRNSKYHINEAEQFISESSDSTSLAHPVSCPVLQDNKTDFEYLYDENDSSTSKESRENMFLNLTTPHAFNFNLSQYNVETPPFFGNTVDSLDASNSSGYESVKSKSKNKTSSYSNFFKKPNIAALFKPYTLNRKKSDLTKYNECSSVESKRSIHAKMVKNCQIYASKIREYKASKSDFFTEYKEFPLNILLSKDNAVLFKDEPFGTGSKHTDEAIDELSRSTSNKNIYYTSKKSDIILDEIVCKSSNDTLKGISWNETYETFSESTETFGVNNPFTEEDLPQNTDDLNNNVSCKIVLSNEVLKVESVTYFVPEIFMEPDDFTSEKNVILYENFDEEVYLEATPKMSLKTVTSEQAMSKKFFESLLKAYKFESEICEKIYQDDEFLGKRVMPLLEKRKSEEKKSRKKGGFSSLFKRKNLLKDVVVKNSFSPKVLASEEYQSRLRDLSSNARKCFCMLADAVKKNKNIDENELKFCGILKMLEMLETGDFQIMQDNEDRSATEEIIKTQVIESFLNVYEICQKEAKKFKRHIGDNELNLIKAFVSIFRAGLLSKTDIIASYIGQGRIHSESQLKAAIIFLMRSNAEELNHKEFEEYCQINQNSNK